MLHEFHKGSGHISVLDEDPPCLVVGGYTRHISSPI